MKKAILATKVGMTQIFAEDGTLIPVTVLQAGPCVVTQVKTVENDGYEAVQVGFVDKKDKIINKDAKGKKEIIHANGTTKAMQGHFKKAGTTSKRFVREFKFENASEYALAQEIKADIFAEGDKIEFHRHQGSNGACSSPSRVFKGKGMPGQMGGKKATVRNLEVVRVDADKNLLLIKGAVPGPKKAMVTIKETTKAEA